MLVLAYSQAVDDQSEANLVDGVTDVVDYVHVESNSVNEIVPTFGSDHVSQRIDAPTNEDKLAQDAVSTLH